MRRNTQVRRLIVVAGLALFAAASVESAHAQKPPPATVRVAAQPLTNFTPLLIAKEKGWFAEENLNVTWTMITQAAIAVEAVFGGSAEFGGGGILEPIVARGNGLDISFAVAGCRVRTKPPDNFGLFVRDGDPIRAPADLVGKRVSAGLINSVSYIHTAAWLRKNGVDPKKFMDTMKSFGVQSKLRRATQQTVAYKIDGTPAMAVAGRYTVSAEQGKTQQGMLQAVDGLVALARKQK